MAVVRGGSRMCRALREFGTSTPQRFKCISIIGSSNGATQLSALGAVSSLGRVRFRGGSTDNYNKCPSFFSCQSTGGISYTKCGQ